MKHRKLYIALICALCCAILALTGCGRESPTNPTDGDADADSDTTEDTDTNDADDISDGDTAADGDADADADEETTDADEETDGDTEPVECTCPEPITECAEIPETAFSTWEDATLTTQILQGIACAENSLDIAVYDIDWECFVDALLDAADRNPSLEIRVVTEFDNCGRVKGELICDLSRLEDAEVAEIVLDNRPSYLMHDKFMIIDGEQAIVSTANWTENGMCSEYNGSLLIEETSIVDALATEFERFFTDQDFGAPTVTEPISSGAFDLYFSPSGADWQDELIARINAADGTIEFMVFAFTSEEIAQAVIDADDRGVTVRGVIGHAFFTSRYQSVVMMVEAGLDLRVSDVHHKSILIDNADDITVATGSGNYSDAARNNNNEIVLFIDNDVEIFDAFDAEFDRIWDVSEVETLD